MKKLQYGAAILPLILLSGCWKRHPKRSDDSTGELVGQVVHEGSPKVFDVDEQGFVLKDEENPFSPGESVALVDDTNPLWNEKDARFEAVYFDFGRDEIRPDQRQVVERAFHELKKELEANPEALIVIEGHACNSAGSPTYNLHLSERRAAAVRRALIQKGLPEDRIMVKGCGSEMRKVLSGNREQQAPNRRVEFRVVMDSSKK